MICCYALVMSSSAKGYYRKREIFDHECRKCQALFVEDRLFFQCVTQKTGALARKCLEQSLPVMKRRIATENTTKRSVRLSVGARQQHSHDDTTRADVSDGEGSKAPVGNQYHRRAVPPLSRPAAVTGRCASRCRRAVAADHPLERRPGQPARPLQAATQSAAHLRNGDGRHIKSDTVGKAAVSVCTIQEGRSAANSLG